MSIRRQTLWNLVPIVVTTAFSLISVRVMYNGLGADMYAILLYVYTLTGTFGFMDLGIGNALVRYMGIALGEGDHQAVKEYWSVGLTVGTLFTALFSLIFILAGVLAGPVWFNVEPQNAAVLQWCFFLGGITLFLSYILALWVRACQVYLDFAFVSKVNIVFFLLQIIPSMYFAWEFGLPILILLWGVIVLVLKFIVLIIYLAKKYDLHTIPRAPFRWQRFGEMKAYMLKSFSSLLVGNLFMGLDRVILGRLASPAVFSHYGIAFNVGNRAKSLSTSFMGPVLSNMNLLLKNKETELTPADVYDYTCSMILDWVMLAITATLFLSKYLLNLLLGEALAADVHPVFIPIVIGCCIHAFSNLSRSTLNSINRVGSIIKANVIAGVLAAVLCFVGFKAFSIEGAAYGYLLSRIIFIFMDWLTVRHFIHAKGIYQWAVLARFIGYIVIGSISYLLIEQAPEIWRIPLTLTILGLIAGGLVYVEMRRPVLGVSGNARNV